MTASTGGTTTTQDYRLPTDVKPTHYDLTVWTDLENNKFEGVVHVEYALDRWRRVPNIEG